MLVEFVTRDYDQPFGLPRYNDSLCRSLAAAGVRFTTVAPSLPVAARIAQPILARLNLDVEAFLNTYPVSAKLSRDSVKHFADYTMATMIRLHHLRHTVVTVHDFSPDWNSAANGSGGRYAVYRAFHRMALAGLRRADAIITDTQHIADALAETVGCKSDRITAIPLGVAHDIFRPINVQQDFMARYGLSEDHRFILSVGTDAPRKNLANLVKAFALVRSLTPNVQLLKVGASGWASSSREVQELIRDLKLAEHVRFLGVVPDDDLARLYNAATLAVYPSFYEGFGLPVLEAMACGTPVITSTTSCLPEVAGGAALLVDPHEVVAMAGAISRLLMDAELRASLCQKGLARAQEFTWERTARETLAVYRRVS